MRLSLSRSSVVVGEPVTATLKIYHRANLVGFENAKFPAFKGFWSQEVETPSNIEFQREQVDGTMYNAAVLRRWVLIPQKSGDQTIEPAEVVCLVNVQRRRSTGSIFDDFFGSDYVTIRQRVTTKAATAACAGPSGRHAGFLRRRRGRLQRQGPPEQGFPEDARRRFPAGDRFRKGQHRPAGSPQGELPAGLRGL